MKIAYVELDTHAELAANFYELTSNSTAVSVDFFCSEKVFKILNSHEENIILTDFSQLLESLQKKSYDLVIIGTVHRHFNFYKSIVDRYNTAVIVHNLNFTKASTFELLKSIFERDFAYRLKLVLKEGLLEAPKVYQNANYRLGIDEEMAFNNGLTYLPIYFNQFITERLEKNVLRIVIPGAVSQSRRDYKTFIDQLKRFRNNGIYYEIVFLGKASGNEWEMLKDFENYLVASELTMIKIIYFDHKIPQNDFDSWMKKADVLYCPIQKETAFFSIKEWYGKTKISGNIGDAIKYAKPAIFPETYDCHLDFIIKKQSDLQAQFSEVRNRTFDFSSFSKDKIQNRILKLIKSLSKPKS